jgi:hypothetical protein
MRALVLVLLAVVACAADPAATAKQPGYPCGVLGVACANGMCCPEATTCGGPFPAVGCPEGQCCAIGGELDAKRARYPQTPAVP